VCFYFGVGVCVELCGASWRGEKRDDDDDDAGSVRYFFIGRAVKRGG